MSVFTNFVAAESESVTISARGEESLRFYLNDGDEMRYTVSVDGGANNDIVFNLKNPYGGSISQGKIIESFSDTIYAGSDGYYIFEFDNSMSLISKKQIVVNYDIIEKPVLLDAFDYDTDSNSSSFSFGYLLFLIPIIIIILVVVVIIRKSKKAYKEGYNEKLYNKNENSEIDDSRNIEKSSDMQKNSEFIGILKERLAKGEITKEEYVDLKKEFEK